jgi:uncharacterized coiled-coil DUF342 family protein
MAMLRSEADYLKQSLEAIKQRISELENQTQAPEE